MNETLEQDKSKPHGDNSKLPEQKNLRRKRRIGPAGLLSEQGF